MFLKFVRIVGEVCGFLLALWLMLLLCLLLVQVTHMLLRGA